MTEHDVRQRARVITKAEGWPWQEPLVITRRRRWVLGGTLIWEVMTNAGVRGGNVYVRINDSSGQVIGKAFARH